MEDNIIRAPLTSEESFTLKAVAMRTNGLERYEKSEIPFRIAFTDEWGTVSITTDISNYAYLNRTFSNEKPEYLYLRTISWIAEISRIVKCMGDYAIFEK